MSISLTGSGPSIELTGSGSSITLTVTTGGGGGGGETESVLHVYVWDGDSYELANDGTLKDGAPRLFFGTADPEGEGFTLADADLWIDPTALGGDALIASNNLSDVLSAATSRTNLGLGDSATLDVGTGSGDVAAGDAPASAVSTHSADTTSVHGISDTSALVDTASVRLPPTPVGATDGHVLKVSSNAWTIGAESGGGGSEPPIARDASNHFMIPHVSIHGEGTQATVADFLYFGCPFPMYEDATLAAVQMRVTSAGAAGCDTRIGLFSIPSDGDLAGTFTLVEDLGTIDTDTSPATVTLSGLSTSMSAGTTYVFGHVSSHNVSFYKTEMQPSTGAIGNTQLWVSGAEVLTSMNKAFTFGALSSSYSAVNLVESNDDGVRNYVAARWS